MPLLLIFILAMKYSLAKEKEYTYLALGDSYTIGEQVPVEANFPNLVRKLAAEKGILMQPPRIIAQTGWTTDELQEALVKPAVREQYDLVTLLIGVNNQYRGGNIAVYAREFESLLRQAIGFSGNRVSHVIVLSIPDWSVTPFAAGRDRRRIAREIDEFNKVNKEIATRYKVHYIDITPSTRRSPGDPSLLAQDGLHPSGKEYFVWAGELVSVLQKLNNSRKNE